ncbi:MAG: acetyl-CoA carboxylase, carboxyltransferase subunit beta [Mariprofundaceae bacterium]
MNWITRFIEKPKRMLGSRAEGTPEGLWEKCPGCGEAIYNRELVKNQMVCPSCSQHLRITAIDRAGFLFDNNSLQLCDENLRSVDTLNFRDKKRYRDRLKDSCKRTGNQDALRNFTGTIKGRSISVSVFEFDFMGGSMGSVVGEKLVRAMDRAIENGWPYLLVTASGGARMQEGIFSLMQMAKASAVAAKLQEARLPFVCLLSDPTMGGVSASVAWLGDIILAEPGALIGFAGPRVIKETVNQELPEGFQRPEFLLEHGLIDDIVDRREVRDYLDVLFGHLMNHPYRPPLTS